MTLMEHLSINDFIIEKCKQGKLEKWPSLYDKIATMIYNQYNVIMGPERIRYVSKKYRKDNSLNEDFEPIKSEDLYNSNIDEKSLLEEHGFDSEKFSLVNYKSSSWTGSDGEEHSSSKISVKPKISNIWNKKFIDKLFSGMQYTGDFKVKEPTAYSEEGSVLVLPIADLHYMRYATMDFTNGEYDTEIARNNLYNVINDIMFRVEGMKLRKIYFILGNDMLNCDNNAGATTRGTIQENCGNIERAILDISDLMVRTIESLKELAPVEVVYIPSNHDYLTFFGIANALRLRYQNDKYVHVDAGYKERKYRLEGSCLLGFAHDAKVDKINDLIMNDAKEYLSESNRRIYFLAHFHHESCCDVNGTEVRRLPSMASNSRWEYNKGYHSVEKCQSFIIDPNIGITDILYSYID